MSNPSKSDTSKVLEVDLMGDYQVAVPVVSYNRDNMLMVSTIQVARSVCGQYLCYQRYS